MGKTKLRFRQEKQEVIQQYILFCFPEFILNPEGKTAVCILHEYAQNVLKSHPTYQFKEIGMYVCWFILNE